MRKKQLIEQNTVLYNKVQELFARNKQLENEIKRLNDKIKSVDVNQRSNFLAPTSEEKINLKSKPMEIPLNEDIDYSSKVIGKIVLESTKSADKLSTQCESQDKRELINLILGRTEVAKAEILKITSSNLHSEDKKAEIDKQYNEAIEYINSVLAQ